MVRKTLLPRFAPVGMTALLATLVLIFAFQADNITQKYLHVLLIAVPMIINRCSPISRYAHRPSAFFHPVILTPARPYDLALIAAEHVFGIHTLGVAIEKMQFLDPLGGPPGQLNAGIF